MKTSNMLVPPVSAGAAVVAMLLGIGGLGSSNESPSADTVATLPGRVFTGTHLVLDGKSRPLNPADGITLGFNRNEARMGAFNGCSDFNSAYQISNGRLLSVGEASSSGVGTEKCSDKENVALGERLDDFYFTGPTIQISDSSITLRGSGVELTLNDRELADPDLPLQGTRWEMNMSAYDITGYGSGSPGVSGGPQVHGSLHFSDTEVIGTVECTDFRGPALLTDHTISIGKMQLKKHAPCRVDASSDSVTDQSNRTQSVLSRLSGLMDWNIASGTLALHHSDGSGLKLSSEHATMTPGDVSG